MNPLLKSVGVLCFALLALLGCEVAADVSTPVKYEVNGISFAYPKNWKITQDEKNESIHQITVDSPGAAVFIATVTPGMGFESLAEFAASFARNSEKAAPFGMIKKPLPVNASGSSEDVIAEKFDITLAGIETPHFREYRLIRSKDRTAYLVSQTAEEDRAMTSPGFALIVKSFAVADRK